MPSPLRELKPELRAGEHSVKRDLTLVEGVKSRDQLAIAELYDHYSRLVYSVAHHVLYDEGAAEDITQEVFLQLWRSPDSFNPARGSLSTWLTVVSRHRAIDKCRKCRAEIDVADVVIPIDGKQYRDFRHNESMGKVDALLSGMPAHLRTALCLAYMEGLTHSEISARTGDPLGTVKSRIRLGLEWIRKRLNEARP